MPNEDEEAEAKPAAPKAKPARKSAKAKRVESDDEVGLVSSMVVVWTYESAPGFRCRWFPGAAGQTTEDHDAC